MFSFSSFLEVLLNENFKTDYINSVIETISGYSLDYRKIYTDCYNHLEKFSKSSLQTIIVDNASSISKFAGNTIAKIPVISKTQIDENLVAIGDKLNVYSDNKTDDIMEQLIKLKDDNTLVFINNIKEIDSIFNKQIKMLFDKENIYYNVAL